MSDRTHPKATNGTPVIVARKTAYYITFGDGEMYADTAGHTWFAKSVALAISRELPGGWFYEGSHSTIKQVVTGYLPPAADEAGEAPETPPAPGIFAQELLDCTCGGIGQTGAHARSCPWAGA